MNEIIFLIILAVSAAGLIVWKKIIDPERGGFWVYAMWVLLCNAISFFRFNPWGVLG